MRDEDRATFILHPFAVIPAFPSHPFLIVRAHPGARAEPSPVVSLKIIEMRRKNRGAIEVAL